MRKMPKPWRVIVAVLVTALAAGACGKTHPRTRPTPAPPSLPPLSAMALTAVVSDWPPALDPVPVSAWVAEVEAAEAESAAARA